MKLRNGNINDLLNFTERKNLVCYGCNDDLTYLCEAFAPFGLLERIDCVADARAEEGMVTVCGAEKPLVRLERLLSQGVELALLVTQTMSLDDLMGIITSDFYGRLGDTAFYTGGFLMFSPPGYILPEPDPRAKPLIPKTIHYCWFGGNPLPPLMKRCVESWKRVCPDYDVVEWNEGNYDVSQIRFVREAYAAKKWAFVSDYVRMDVIYRFGGIYMDTDVELIKPLDRFLTDKAFCGMEAPNFPALSLPFGALTGNELVRGFRDMYNNIPFVKPDGSYDMTPCTLYHAMLFRQLGLTKENKVQSVGGFTVYPTDVFCPVHPNLVYESFSEKTHSIHYYTGSWHTDKENENKFNNVLKYREILDNLHGGGLYKIPFFR